MDRSNFTSSSTTNVINVFVILIIVALRAAGFLEELRAKEVSTPIGHLLVNKTLRESYYIIGRIRTTELQ